MSDHAGHACTFSRRRALKGLGAVGAASAVTAGGFATAGQAGAVQLKPALPIPKPIGSRLPSGLPEPMAQEIAFALPGPLGATTPVIGLEAMGLDIEPSTIGDFSGFTAFAVVAGQARASDGNLYPFEFDVRAMKGRYIAEDGTEQRAEFAFMWVDLFDFSLESPQIVDMTPGITPNGLFWTTRLPGGAFRFRPDGKKAWLNLRGFPLVDTISYGNLANALNAEVDVSLEWRATGDAEDRGLGAAAAEDDPGRFEGRFAESVCTGRVSGRRTGFSFRTGQLTSADYYATIGNERNGSYL